MCPRPQGNWADLRKTIFRWWQGKGFCMRTMFKGERRAGELLDPLGASWWSRGCGGKLPLPSQLLVGQDDRISPVISAQEEKE